MSIDKSKHIIFGNKCKMGKLNLNLYGKGLERVNVFKFLGVQFDKRLTWNTHINKIVSKCDKILCCLAGSSWGADKGTQLMVYRAMVRSSTGL